MRRPTLFRPFTGLIVVLPLLVTARLAAQSEHDATSSGGFVNTCIPGDAWQEIWLQTRTGTIVLADIRDVSWQAGALAISGTLRDMRLPTSDIRGISYLTGGHGFRNGVIEGGYIGCMLLLSPAGTPAYYLGSAKTTEGAQIPGFSAASAIIASAIGVTTGLIADMRRSRSLDIPLDGTESERAWRALLEERNRWHVRGCTAAVISSQQDAWRAHHALFGIEDWQPSGYFSSVSEVSMTNINMARLIRLGYSVSRRVEFGLAWQSDGVQPFEEQITFTRPGTPPQPVVQQLSNRLSSSIAALTLQYDIPIERSNVTASIGVGFGVSSVSVTVGGFAVAAGDQEIVNTTGFGMIAYAALEYFVDRDLSIGVQADYSSDGKVSVPSQSVTDWDGRTYATISAFDLPVRSFGVGLVFGLHW